MCSSTAVLHRIPRIVIGEQHTFQGREDWLKAENVELVLMNDLRCISLMDEFITARPELWNEDISVAPKA